MAKLHTYMAGPNHALEPLQRNDEIDLLALVALLWSGRLIIISCIILFGAVGGCYALLAPERFTANAVIYYPSSQDMLVLVPLRTKLDTLGLGGVPSNKTLYEDFIVQYRSYDNFQRFMKESEYGLKHLGGGDDERSKEQLLRQWFTTVTEDLTNKKRTSSDGVMLSFSGPNRRSAFDLLKGYIQYVVNMQQHQLLNALSKNRILQLDALSLMLTRKREDAQRQLMNEIAAIERGVAIAKAAVISEPLENVNEDGRFPFTLGYEALSTKLSLMRGMPIEQYDTSLAELDVQLSRLKKLTLSIEDVNFRPFSFLDAPSIPLSRDKPKRALVVILSLMLGVMMGVAIVLVKSAIASPS
ncbi:LPS O-antigen chain length determinant protein WzzB [Aeromonas jandaei]|uniref:LPS O-antigen chain length determinant protein WzzB n=1 Tax=Aeromonas jandaei TaxID=650 RepID=UPI003985E971